MGWGVGLGLGGGGGAQELSLRHVGGENLFFFRFRFDETYVRSLLKQLCHFKEFIWSACCG